MKARRVLIILSALKVTTVAHAHATHEAPETRFHRLIDRIERAFVADVAARGYELRIERHWEDNRANAQITRDDVDNPIMRVYGGLGRHPEMTEDAFLLILCHELGHYLGGAPKAPRGNSGKKSWSSTEGQADYFASSKCMKRLIAEESSDEKSGAPTGRILAAGLAAARFFAKVSGGGSPSLDRKDQTVVSETISAHPSAQCRLDTFVAGALCDAPATLGFDDSDPAIGACGTDEKQAPGARPRCWYSPK